MSADEPSGSEGTACVPLREAQERLAALVAQAWQQDVILTDNGRMVAVLVSPARMDALMERLDDAENSLSVHEREPGSVSAAQLYADLGLADAD